MHPLGGGMVSEESLLEALFMSAPDGILFVSVAGRVVRANPAAARIFGYAEAELVGLPLEQLVPDELREKHVALRRGYLEHGRPRAMGSGPPLAGRRKDGARVPLDIMVGSARSEDGVTLYAVFRDLTEQTRVEAKLRQAQDLEAVGRLAGGVAHDFNNVLSVILATVDLAMRSPSLDEETRADLAMAKDAGRHAMTLTRQLLAFSRKQVLQPRDLDLNEIVSRLENVVQRMVGEDIDIDLRLTSDPAHVRADPSQIEQVILNLAANARDAMPDGGTVEIVTTHETLDAEQARQVNVAPATYVVLRISDVGVGMDADTRARAFEPFFSTKGRQGGTGLGLATVHGIVHQSGGGISLESAPGRGTSITLYFPRSPSATTSSSKPSHPRLSLNLTNDETILVIEDQHAVRRALARSLSRFGFVVLEASGDDAVAIARQHAGAIHVVVSDVVLPGTNGRELAARISSERPEARTILMSGYTDDMLVRRGVHDDSLPFLQKPFSSDALVAKIREVLGKADADRG